MSYNTINCYYKYFDVEPDFIKLDGKKMSFFNKKEPKNTRIRETDEEIWKRINAYIDLHKLVIINFEAIYNYKITTGGDFCQQERITNDNIVGCDNIIGYRLFYKHIHKE